MTKSSKPPRNCNLPASLLLSLIVLAVDQWSKITLVKSLTQKQESVEITSFFNLVMAWNKGVSFSMFASYDMRWALTAMAFIMAFGLLIWLIRDHGSRLQSMALGSIIGGAIGNGIDRIRWGAVADFFDFHYAGYHYPAFNIADCAIVLGVITLTIASLLYDKKEST